MLIQDKKILSEMSPEECLGTCWFGQCLLKGNSSVKCLVMYFGQNNNKCPLYINGKQLVESNSERDLDFLEEFAKCANFFKIFLGEVLRDVLNSVRDFSLEILQ